MYLSLSAVSRFLMAVLPESFDNLSVGKYLALYGNELATRPKMLNIIRRRVIY